MSEPPFFDWEPIPLAHFFRLESTIPYVKSEKQFWGEAHQLPDLSDLLHQDPFAQGFIGYDDQFLWMGWKWEEPLYQAVYPQFTEGQAIEVFIDTRDVKTAVALSRFCYHLLFLPEPSQGVQVAELSKVRLSFDREPLDPSLPLLETTPRKDAFFQLIKLPFSACVGLNPSEFSRLGFHYRLHSQGKTQDFVVSSQLFKPEYQPHLWASLSFEM